MHSVFLSDKLWKAAINFFLGQIEDPPPAIEINKKYK